MPVVEVSKLVRTVVDTSWISTLLSVTPVSGITICPSEVWMPKVVATLVPVWKVKALASEFE